MPRGQINDGRTTAVEESPSTIETQSGIEREVSASLGFRLRRHLLVEREAPDELSGLSSEGMHLVGGNRESNDEPVRCGKTHRMSRSYAARGHGNLGGPEGGSVLDRRGGEFVPAKEKEAIAKHGEIPRQSGRGKRLPGFAEQGRKRRDLAEGGGQRTPRPLPGLGESGTPKELPACSIEDGEVVEIIEDEEMLFAPLDS